MLPIPEHVAIIMDGNRRWAEENDVSVEEGHEKGREVIEEVIETAFDMGVKHLSPWALSLDNQKKRSQEEVNQLMQLFKRSFRKIAENDKIHENKVKVNVLGRWRERLPPKVTDAIEKAIEKTEDYSDHFLNLLVSYSGKDEMLHAISKILDNERKGGDVDLNTETVKQHLFTSNLPPVDLMIRTGGEPHNSAGFMMWDIANSQFYFTDKHWPDFGEEEFKKAIEDYRNRERRFGE